MERRAKSFLLALGGEGRMDPFPPRAPSSSTYNPEYIVHTQDWTLLEMPDEPKDGSDHWTFHLGRNQPPNEIVATPVRSP